MEPVGVGLRAVATIIDTALLFIVGYIIALFTGDTTGGGFQLSGLPFFLWLIIAIGYYTVMEAQSGATIGKRLVGLKVVKLDAAAPIDMQTSLVRNVLRLVDGFLFYLIAAISVWMSDKKQRIGDRVARTVVIRARASDTRVP
jgi:uncharacterized RDD family membrane protein YckC